MTPRAGFLRRSRTDPQSTGAIKKAEREEPVISLLCGAIAPQVERAEIEGLSLKRMCNIVRGMLAERMPAATVEFLALQVSRVDEVGLGLANCEDPFSLRETLAR